MAEITELSQFKLKITSKFNRNYQFVIYIPTQFYGIGPSGRFLRFHYLLNAQLWRARV